MELFIPILLIFFGLALIALEVYVVPGIGVVGFVGGAVIIAGVVYAFVTNGFGGGLIAASGSLALGGGMFYLMWESGAWDRFVLAASLSRDTEADARDADARSRYLGREAIAITPLRPGGIVEVSGERVEVQTEGEFIASGSMVRIVAMDRRRFFVRMADAPDTEPAASGDA